MQKSLTLDLADDCFRFVTGFFDIISASSPHIYHSALFLAPQNSIVRKIYEPHTRPLIKVVHGVPMSWDASPATRSLPSRINLAVWSPCSRFIGIARTDALAVDILDSVTLQQVQTLNLPHGTFTGNMALAFSLDSRILTCSSYFRMSRLVARRIAVSWDLQTGGVASVIRCQASASRSIEKASITHSASGRMIGVFTYYRDEDDANRANISILDVATRLHIYSHSFGGGIPLSNNVWTQGDRLRFAVANATTITIRECGFTPDATPVEVETLPTPEDFGGGKIGHGDVQFFPASCCLAFVFRGGVLVWDARNSKTLLRWTDAKAGSISFSSFDGRFFASGTGSEIHLWRVSPTGYTPYKIISRCPEFFRLLLSRDGESIATFGDRTTWLWHTKGFATTPSSVSTQPPRRTNHFILDFSFSSNGLLAVAAMRGSNVVTVLNLKSGAPQLIIDTSMGVHGLKVIGNSVVVLGCQKAITWNILAGDCVPGARMGLKESSSTLILSRPPEYSMDVIEASISSDSRYIFLATREHNFQHIYSASTGEHLGYVGRDWERSWFAPNGRDIWCVGDNGEAQEVWRVTSGEKVLERLDYWVAHTEHLPEGYPWRSSRGYRVTSDWWIVNSDRKRVLMLPPPWQSDAVQRVWGGQFLALLHRGLPEPVILDLE